MRIFAEKSLYDLLSHLKEEARKEIFAEQPNKLLNVNETDYINYLVAKCSLEPLEFHQDKVTVSQREEMIPAEMFPRAFATRRGESYRCSVITFHLPFTGDAGLLRFKPSEWLHMTYEVKATDHEISFDVVNWNNEAQSINREKEEKIRFICQQAGNMQREIEGHNKSLEGFIRQALHARKEGLLKQQNLLQSLGVPLRKSDSVPETFAVPLPAKRLVVKPESPSTAYAPEPTLSDGQYNDILHIIHETGVAMERTPNVYTDKGEEALRDHLIMVLSTHYPSTTGESFNKSGKTDILVRHEGKNVFVAECKIWGGQKLYLDTIDQVLGYLTWRDSKTAVVCFVRNKELQPVLNAIKKETSTHKCFVKNLDSGSDGQFRFEFRMKDDPTRKVHLAVLCFHFPEDTP